MGVGLKVLIPGLGMSGLVCFLSYSVQGDNRE
jgi:hypothetical protein